MTLSFHTNHLVDGKIEESFTPQKKSLLDMIRNVLYPGEYRVRRCGFYKGNYSIERVRDAPVNGTPTDDPDIAFTGEYSDCYHFRRQNQTYVYFERS